jgi:hypothetical protein
MSNEQPDFTLTDSNLHLVELVNRVLDRGALISGEITISVGGVDLLYLGLQLVLTSTETAAQRPDLISRMRP